jgi:hypothetical protein
MRTDRRTVLTAMMSFAVVDGAATSGTCFTLITMDYSCHRLNTVR